MEKCAYCGIKIKEHRKNFMCMTCEIITVNLKGITTFPFPNKKSMKYWAEKINSIL